LPFELSRSGCILSIVGVLSAICLDDQPVFGARKIDDVLPYRMLPAEFVSRQAPIA